MKFFIPSMLSIMSIVSFCAEKNSTIPAYKTAVLKKLETKGKGQSLYLEDENLTKILKQKAKARPVYDVIDGKVIARPAVDLSGAYLKRAKLGGLYVAAINLAYANCDETDLSHADFTDENRQLYYMNHVDLHKADLRGAKMYPSQIYCSIISPGWEQKIITEQYKLLKIRIEAEKRQIRLITEQEKKPLTYNQAKHIKDLVETGNGKGRTFTGLDLHDALILRCYNNLEIASVGWQTAYIQPCYSPGEYLMSFKGAILDRTNFSKLDVSNINFERATAIGANFRKTVFGCNVNTKNFDLSKAKVTGAKMGPECIFNTLLIAKQRKKFKKEINWDQYKEIPDLVTMIETVAKERKVIIDTKNF